MNKVKSFFVRNKNKVVTAGATIGTFALTSGVSSFAAYSPKPIPTGGSMSWDVLGDLWEYAASMTLDVIQIVASQPLMVAMVALSLIGIGVGLFKRLLSA